MTNVSADIPIAMPLEGRTPVGDNTHLFYMDSGAVSNVDSYSTIVAFHGAMFNGYALHKLLPLAAPSRTRLVLVNKRGYRHSSPYTERELGLIKSGDVIFLQDRAVEVAHFLLWFIKEQKLPKVTFDANGRAQGGIFLVGWASGGVLTLSLFGQELPPGLAAELRPYLRKLVMYETPFFVLGYPPPSSITEAKFYPNFDSADDPVKAGTDFVSMHWDHPDLASHSITGLNVDELGTNSTLDQLRDEEFSAMVDGEQLMLTEIPVVARLQQGLHLLTNRALFQLGENKAPLDDVEAITIWCRNSPAIYVWCAFESMRMYKEHLAKGDRVRANSFVDIEGNHMVHWEEPERFWKFLQEHLQC